MPTNTKLHASIEYILPAMKITDGGRNGQKIAKHSAL